MFFILENIAVFFGGVSTEREISVITGVLVVNCLDKTKYNAIPIYINGDGKFYTSPNFNNIKNLKNPDLKKADRVTFVQGESLLYKIGKKLVPISNINCAINCLHGKNGEDGVIIGLLKLCNIPTASPDICASSLFMDKDLSKNMLKGLDVPFVDYIRIKNHDFFKKSEKYLDFIEKKLQFPIIIKPARLGSSIGIKVAKDRKELFECICSGFSYDSKVICEKYIEGARDINIALYYANGKTHISKCEEAFSTGKILSFEDKYGGGEKIPQEKRNIANLPKNIREKIEVYSQRIYRKCDFCGIVRFDYLVKDENCYINEVNTVPGSLAYYLFCNKFGEFSNLLTDLIEEGKSRARDENNLIKVFSSSILNGDFANIKK